KLQLQPVMLSFQIVSQQRRRLVHIQDQNVQVSIVVEIAEYAAAARVWSRNTRAGIGNLLKGSVTQVSEEDARRFIGICGSCFSTSGYTLPVTKKMSGQPS